MDNVNKIISFVLGLIVVIVILLLITGRLGLFKGAKLFTARGSTSTSPTPNNKATPTPKRLAQNTSQPKTIPSTGAETDVLVLVSIALVGGIYLRKVKSTS